MKSQEELQQEIDDLVEEFEYIETPIDSMQFIIDFPKENGWKNDTSLVGKEEYLIKGCVSIAYLNVKNIHDEIELSYYADAVIIQGFFAVLSKLLKGTSHKELESNLQKLKFLSKTIGLESFLSPNRANALYNIFRKIEEKI